MDRKKEEIKKNPLGEAVLANWHLKKENKVYIFFKKKWKIVGSSGRHKVSGYERWKTKRCKKIMDIGSIDARH